MDAALGIAFLPRLATGFAASGSSAIPSSSYMCGTVDQIVGHAAGPQALPPRQGTFRVGTWASG
ncbi:hypothetical protein [Sphingobium sp. MK2]|uniref:hypothetical protein n=1 Tax=Sphingobium sp. MK2 TaxID=3116540 RepID=UPI0032E35CBA